MEEYFFHVARLCALVAGNETYPPLFSQKKKTLGCKKIPIATASNENFRGEKEALLLGLLRGDRMDGRRAADTKRKRQRSGPGSPPRCNTRKRRRMSGVGEMHGERRSNSSNSSSHLGRHHFPPSRSSHFCTPSPSSLCARCFERNELLSPSFPRKISPSHHTCCGATVGGE